MTTIKTKNDKLYFKCSYFDDCLGFVILTTRARLNGILFTTKTLNYYVDKGKAWLKNNKSLPEPEKYYKLQQYIYYE